MSILETNKKLSEITQGKIIITENVSGELKKFVLNFHENKIFMLTDENTYKYCLPKLDSELTKNFNIYTIKSGEENKNIDTLSKIWEFLTKEGADRKSLLINLGGGMLTDIGGFAASTFKRGIEFINIPTSLLGQVDASCGGKTGINFAGLKNEIGIINQAQTVLIDSIFLQTLEKTEFLSGFSEMIKHSLIADKEYYEELLSFDLSKKELDRKKLNYLIEKSVIIKYKITEHDPFEKGIRKALNFGHTFGHAFESLSHEQNKPLKHGQAVAQGMICELFLSNKKKSFPIMKLLDISGKIMSIFEKFEFETTDFEKIINFILHDKKNTNSQINCTLLSELGIVEIDQKISESEIKEALNYYLQIFL